ncbi:E3 ubiquitin-protein ligase UPL1-like [Iris pallida]|uniref:E3 ubiquitin-protein ligase UPL1-like n=1 Tax=Iris pallida TaxID=29817 RepID=A0AAX6GT19_IRIPA|nr:E3 ubiquitin-protein ligase UPL1-like [Iris pallida]KAJ6831401.1 E3 ubiquitin-protein ligase UPL1-like [Iris pallida]
MKKGQRKVRNLSVRVNKSLTVLASYIFNQFILTPRFPITEDYS